MARITDAIRDKADYYVAPARLKARLRAAIAAEAGAAPARPSRQAQVIPRLDFSRRRE
jgi:hypothetical protein